MEEDTIIINKDTEEVAIIVEEDIIPNIIVVVIGEFPLLLIFII